MMIDSHPLRIELDAIVHFAMMDTRKKLPRCLRPVMDEDVDDIDVGADPARAVTGEEVMREVATTDGKLTSAQLAARMLARESDVERALNVMELSGRVQRIRRSKRVTWKAAA